MHRPEENITQTGYSGTETLNATAKIESYLDSYTDSIINLKNQIQELQQIRDQTALLITQFQKDIDESNEVYKYLKSHINVYSTRPPPLQKLGNNSNLQVPSIPQNIEPQQVQQLQQAQPVLQSQPVPQNESQESTTAIQYTVEPANSYFDQSKIILRHSFNLESVICAVQFDYTGNMIAFADTKSLHIVDVTTGKTIQTTDFVRPQSRVDLYTRAIKFSPDGGWIAFNIAPNSIGIYSIPKASIITTLEEHTSPISALQFTEDTKILISGGSDGVICLWDVPSFKLIRKIINGPIENDNKPNKESAIAAIISGPGDSYFIVGFLSGDIAIFDNQFNKELYRFKAHNNYLMTLAMPPNSNQLFTTSCDNLAKLFTISPTGTASETIVFTGHEDFVTAGCVSSTEPLLITGAKDEKIALWDTRTGERLCFLRAHDNTVLGLAHHPHARIFVSSSGDGHVCVWEYSLP